MKLHQTTADLFIPDDAAEPAALARTTHLGIGAHQDDLEIMAFHGIIECFGRTDRWFTGVTCTDGAGSPRSGVYAHMTDADMRRVRREEQRVAASIGRYGAMLQLDHPSAAVKNPAQTSLVDDLVSILEATRPGVVYTHNPADKHDTHIGVMAAVIRALRRLPAAARPERVYGCEVWRDLDWLGPEHKVALNVSGYEHLGSALTGVFDSQISGGKRYDLATLGRRRANATYAESHSVDAATELTFALDLTPLIRDDTLEPADYVQGLVRAFETDVRNRVSSRWPAPV